MSNNLVCYICANPLNKSVCIDCSTGDKAKRRDLLNKVQEQRNHVELLLKPKLKQLTNYNNRLFEQKSKQEFLTVLQETLLQEQKQLNELKQRNKTKRLQIANVKNVLNQHEKIIKGLEQKKITPFLTEKRSKYLNYSTVLQQELLVRRRYLVEKLVSLYVIKRVNDRACSICHLILPDDCEYIEYDAINTDSNEVIAAALGYLLFVIQHISLYLDCSLPYSMNFHGSHSSLVYYSDNVNNNSIKSPSSFNDLSQYEQKYFLRLESSKSEDMEQFRRAVFLLAHNINFLCAQWGVATEQIKTFHLLPNVLLLLQAIQLNLKNRDINTLKQAKQAQVNNHSNNTTTANNNTAAHNNETSHNSSPNKGSYSPSSRTYNSTDLYGLPKQNPVQKLNQTTQFQFPLDSIKNNNNTTNNNNRNIKISNFEELKLDRYTEELINDDGPTGDYIGLDDSKLINGIAKIIDLTFSVDDETFIANNNSGNKINSISQSNIKSSGLVTSNILSHQHNVVHEKESSKNNPSSLNLPRDNTDSVIMDHFPSEIRLLSQYEYQKNLNSLSPHKPKVAPISYSIPDEEYDMIEVEHDENDQDLHDFNPFMQ